MKRETASNTDTTEWKSARIEYLESELKRVGVILHYIARCPARSAADASECKESAKEALINEETWG